MRYYLKCWLLLVCSMLQLRSDAVDGVDTKVVTVVVSVEETKNSGTQVANLRYRITSVETNGISLGGFSDPKGLLHLQLVSGKKYQVLFEPSLQVPYYGTAVIQVADDTDLPSSKTIEVTVKKCTSVSGCVVNEDGTPVSGMRISVWLPSDEEGSRTTKTSYTDKKGYFSISRLRCVHDLEVFGIHEKYEVKETRVTPGTEPVMLVAKKKTPPLKCVLVDSSGAKIRVDGWCSLKGAVAYGVKIKDGSFMLPDLVSGTYRIIVQDNAAKPVAVRNSSFTFPCSEATMKFILEDKKITLITLFDEESGEPISNAIVMVSQNDSIQHYSSNAKGVVSIDAWPGDISIDIRSAGYIGKMGINATAGKDSQVSLKRGVVINGVVVNEKGVGIEGAIVVLFHPELGERGMATSARGEFKFVGLLGGVAKYVVHADGYATIVDAVRINKKRSAIKIVLNHGVSVGFDIENGIDIFQGESILEGHLVVVQMPVYGIVGAVRSLPGVSKNIALKPGSYNLVWAGEDIAFNVKSIDVERSGVVQVRIRKPKSSEAMSLKGFILRTLKTKTENEGDP